MTNQELEKELSRFYEKHRKTGVILFGIKYSSQLEGKSIGDIVGNVFSAKRQKNGERYSPNTYKPEAREGVELAKFVNLKPDIDL